MRFIQSPHRFGRDRGQIFGGFVFTRCDMSAKATALHPNWTISVVFTHH
jgi:hypothetical protein